MTAGARRKGDPLISRRRRQLQALQRSEALIDLREGDLDGTHAGIEAADVGLEAVEAAVQPSANSITVTDNWTVTTATPVPTIHFASLLIGGKRTHPLARIIQCAVTRRHFSAGANPARQLSLQPVAVGADDGGNDIV